MVPEVIFDENVVSGRFPAFCHTLGEVCRVENVPGWKTSQGGKRPGVEKVPGWQTSKMCRGSKCSGWKSFGVEKVPGWKLSRGGKCPWAWSCCCITVRLYSICRWKIGWKIPFTPYYQLPCVTNEQTNKNIHTHTYINSQVNLQCFVLHIRRLLLWFWWMLRVQYMILSIK